jgi:hypothetical protein
MIVKASWRSALIVAAGLLALLASPVTAATDSGDSTQDSTSDSKATGATHRTYRNASHHRRHYAHRRSHAVATKADDKEADKKVAIAEATPGDNRVLSNIPPSIANANAQMLLAGVQLSAAAAIPSGSDVPTDVVESQTNAKSDSGTVMAAADQLNDADKTLQESTAPSTPAAATTPGSQAAPTGTPPATAAVTMTSEGSTWNQTSLIGKIFIGFGALLTMASAARMFIG